MAEVKIFKEAMDRGLEGVVACSTRISSIQDATLCYRGYSIEDLVENSHFEEVAFLLWNDRLPKSSELDSLKKRLWDASRIPQAFQDILAQLYRVFPKNGHPMDFLRSAVSVYSGFDPQVNDMSEAANQEKSIRLAGALPSIVAAFHRLRQGQACVEPKEGQNVAWNFLYMLFGKEPTAEHARIFDTALILHADHEINCSAFSARVTASSLSDLYSAVVSAIGTLKGPLHGGANEAVMKMLKEIGSADRVEAFIDQALAGKQKVMGIGHRVYKNGDPRARILRKLSEKLTREVGRPELYEMSVRIDEAMFQKRGLMPNVDFYSATVYDSMGIPTDLFTPIFAVSRVVGWCAHIMEQLSNNRIYRPRGEYVGKTGLIWKHLGSRE